MSRWIGVIVALLIGIAIGIAIGSREAGKPNHIMLRVDETSKRVLVNPQYGDVIEWRKATLGGGLEPTKPVWVWGQSPCDKSNDKVCSITEYKGMWAYHGQGDSCIDPEVPIGDEIVVKSALAAGLSTPAPVPENIGCNGSNVAIDPASPVNVSKSLHGAVNWTALGEAHNHDWKLSNWRDMNNMPQQVCTSDVNQDQNLCTLAPSAMPGVTYKFDATVDACSGTKTATFELMVLQ
jgi:hypothetical protein